MSVRPVLVLLFLLILPSARAQFTQQGPKLVGNVSSVGGEQGSSVALSADGNTAIVGAPVVGAAFVFFRSNGIWKQQGELVGSDGAGAGQGFSVGISADGNTAIVGGTTSGGCLDVCSGATGVWMFTRTNGLWTQDGYRLLGGSGTEGTFPVVLAVAIAGDGNTAVAVLSGITGGLAWILTRSNGVWVPSTQLSGAGWSAVSISADGKTIAAGAPGDRNGAGTVWVFTVANGVWFHQVTLTGTGATSVASLGSSVAASADGNTIVAGGPGNESAWVFTRTNGAWNQQNDRLVVNGETRGGARGTSVGISADGSRIILGGPVESGPTLAGAFNGDIDGAAWVFNRINGQWYQSQRLFSTDVAASYFGPAEGASVALSGDGTTAIVGGPQDGNFHGASWVYVNPPTADPVSVSPAVSSGAAQTLTLTFTDSGGWQNLTVVNLLIASAVDGRQACYLAFVPGGTLYLVDDAGDAGGPYSSMAIPGNGVVQNSQCMVSGAGSSVAGNGNVLTLTLNIRFLPAFQGNKIVYLAAQDSAMTSGWRVMGAWINAGVPALSPPAGNGFGGTYSFTFTDSAGWQDLSVVNILLGSELNAINGCYFAFVPKSGALYLVGDAGSTQGPYAGTILPGAATISNSQCAAVGSGSYMIASGNTLTLTLELGFSPGFAGNQIVYAAARGATQTSGWQPVGMITVP